MSCDMSLCLYIESVLETGFGWWFRAAIVRVVQTAKQLCFSDWMFFLIRFAASRIKRARTQAAKVRGEW